METCTSVATEPESRRRGQSELPWQHHSSVTLFEIVDECMMLWGVPEQVHMQNMEQLQAHDHHQNVTEHGKATEYILNVHTYTQHRNWCSIPCSLQDMYTEATWTDSSPLPSFLTWANIYRRAIDSDEWLTQELWVRQAQIITSTDETFLPCGSPYCSSYWKVGPWMVFVPFRHWGGRLFIVHVFNSFLYHFEWMHDTRTCKMRSASHFQHDIQLDIRYRYTPPLRLTPIMVKVGNIVWKLHSVKEHYTTQSKELRTPNSTNWLSSTVHGIMAIIQPLQYVHVHMHTVSILFEPPYISFHTKTHTSILPPSPSHSLLTLPFPLALD